MQEFEEASPEQHLQVKSLDQMFPLKRFLFEKKKKRKKRTFSYNLNSFQEIMRKFNNLRTNDELTLKRGQYLI